MRHGSTPTLLGGLPSRLYVSGQGAGSSTPPTIGSVDQAIVPIARTFRVTGTNFVDGGTTATIDGTNSTVSYVDATHIDVTVPNKAAGTYPLVVTTAEGSSAESQNIQVPTLVHEVIGAADFDTANAETYVQDTADTVPAYARVIAHIMNSETTTTGIAPTSVTGWGLTWAQLQTIGFNPDANGQRLNLWETQNNTGSATASSSLTANFAGDGQTGCAIATSAYTFSPACPFVPSIIESNQDTIAATTTPVLDTLAAITRLVAMVEAAFAIGRAPTAAPDTGWTEDVDSSYATPARGLWVIHSTAVTTDNTPSGTWASGASVATAVVIG